MAPSLNLTLLTETLSGVTKGTFPLDKDISLDISGVAHLVGRHSYGITTIRRRTWSQDGTKAFHIGRFCSIADNVSFMLGGNHVKEFVSTAAFSKKYFPDVERLEKERKSFTANLVSKGNITIGHDVWIGSYATIMSGITIGSGAVVAANAHVVKDVPPYAIVGGNPAKIIRYRFSAEIINLLLQLKWWELDDAYVNFLLPVLLDEPSVETLKILVRECVNYPRSNNLEGVMKPECPCLEESSVAS